MGSLRSLRPGPGTERQTLIMDAITATSVTVAPASKPRAAELPKESGKPLPPSGNNPPPPPEPADVQRAVEQIQTYLSNSQRSLQFRVDESLGRPVMVVTNPETGEVIRQIPGEEVQKMAAAVAQGSTQLLDTLA